MRAFSLLALFLALFVGARYPSDPPPAHTGGFGEPTCHHCHFDHELNAEGGSLMLSGAKEGYVAGEWYTLEVLLTRAEMERAGFQVSARLERGEQAGLFMSVDEQVAMDTLNGIQYLRQTEAGSYLSVQDTARWQIKWQAPADTSGVIFHLTSNAANGDNSEFGDFIYQFSLELTGNH